MEKVYLSDAGPKVSPAIYGFWRWEFLGVMFVSALTDYFTALEI